MAEVAVRTSAGVVSTVDGARVVILDDGTRIRPLWPTTPVADTDRVQVIVLDGVAHVIGPVLADPRPVSGTVAGAASAGRVPVTTAAGTVQARYTGTAPSLGTLVALIWSGTTALLLPGTLAALPSDPQPSTPEVPQPPPTGPTTGTLDVPAVGSGSWRTGGWGWASSTDVLQGGSPFVSQDSRGGWWYGSAPRQLAGRTITGFRLRLGSRARVGNYNDPATIHLYRTGDSTRPGGDFTRIAGPYDVPAGNEWVALPASIGQALVDSGGGIGVLGGPYAGLVGVGSDAASGQISLDWTK